MVWEQSHPQGLSTQQFSLQVHRSAGAAPAARLDGSLVAGLLGRAWGTRTGCSFALARSRGLGCRAELVQGRRVVEEVLRQNFGDFLDVAVGLDRLALLRSDFCPIDEHFPTPAYQAVHRHADMSSDDAGGSEVLLRAEICPQELVRVIRLQHTLPALRDEVVPDGLHIREKNVARRVDNGGEGSFVCLYPTGAPGEGKKAQQLNAAYNQAVA